MATVSYGSPRKEEAVAVNDAAHAAEVTRRFLG
jgi:hypothetical protein